MVFQESLKGVLRVLFKNVSRMIIVCFKSVPKKSQGSVMIISMVFQACLKGVLELF